MIWGKWQKTMAYFLLTVFLLGAGVIYYHHACLREAAEAAAREGVAKLYGESGTLRLIRVESLRELDEKGISDNVEETLSFQKNMVREKCQQRSAIAGKKGEEFFASDSVQMDGLKEPEGGARQQAAGNPARTMQEIHGGRKASVILLKTIDGEQKKEVADEIDCYYYAVQMEEPMPLMNLIGKNEITWTYAALGTAVAVTPKEE